MKTDGIMASAAGQARPAACFAARLAPRGGPRRVPRKASRRQGREPESDLGRDLLIALDSDGTVLDSMAPKHELCFGPTFAERFGRAADRESMREVWRFVNLGSRMRGTNRYKALAAALRLAARRPGLAAALRREEPLAAALEAWLSSETTPTLAHLEQALFREIVDPCLSRVLEWSREVDASIEALPRPRAFVGAAAALPSMSERAEILVLTAAPAAAVSGEWRDAGLGAYAACVAGQELGSKAAVLAAVMSGRYAPEAVLVVGDAPGDLEAARAAGTAFFPIMPGREEESWSALASSFLPRFVAGEAPRGPVAAFLAALPSDPPWRA